MQIYTKSGDAGETSLVGGSRVKKTDLRIYAAGEIDELQSTIGLARSLFPTSKHDALLRELQMDLFYAGADVATPMQQGEKARRISEVDVEKIEKKIDEIDGALPKLTNFILPEGTQFACALHVARNVCRRAERTVVALREQESANPLLQVYLNRLSDLLFVLARDANLQAGNTEEKWIA